MINSERLRSFIAFAEELNFTRAAARLNLSQPALHVQIQKLSDDIGAPLYERSGRVLALTRHGRDLLAFAREIRDRTDAFMTELRGARAETVGLAAGEGTVLYLLGGAIQKAARIPGVKLRIVTRDRDGTLAALATGEVHLGVTTLDAVPDGLSATILRRSAMILVMPPRHRLARKAHVRLADLAGERLILPPAARPHRQHVARALASSGTPWELALEASGWEVMLRYAALGVGLAIVNDTCRLPRGTVARPIPELPALHYHVLHRARVPLSPAAAALRASIVQAFAAPREGRQRRASG
ncbi:MAG: LysR family transcriptional regulator [Acidobacteriota bacterium]